MKLPGFLKYAYTAIVLGCLGWYLLSGSTIAHASSHPVTRPVAAQSPTYLYAFPAVALMFALAVVFFALRQSRRTA